MTFTSIIQRPKNDLFSRIGNLMFAKKENLLFLGTKHTVSKYNAIQMMQTS